jgi:peptidoglycan/xylan/chitin deacetylase (PgdA/CDA1 family)
MSLQRFVVVFLTGLMLFPGVVIGQDSPLPQDSSSFAWQETESVWDGTYRRIRVPILMYHYVSQLPDDADEYRRDLTILPDVFHAHMEYLFFEGYSTISLYQLDDALRTGTPLPPKPIVLTFDDGYIDHYTNVFPSLREYEFTGTFFIITSRPDSNDSNYMNWTQIQEMSDAGMSMESHTKTHQSLRERDYDFLVYEMLGSIESLQAYTARQPHMFSFPVGHYDDATLAVAQTLPIWRAVTTHNGRYHTTDNRFELDRVRISGGMGVPGLASVLRGN